MENGILDSSQRMETIIFENTTYKSKPCGESKSKYNSNMKQRNDKGKIVFCWNTYYCFLNFLFIFFLNKKFQTHAILMKMLKILALEHLNLQILMVKTLN